MMSAEIEMPLGRELLRRQDTAGNHAAFLRGSRKAAMTVGRNAAVK